MRTAQNLPRTSLACTALLALLVPGAADAQQRTRDTRSGAVGTRTDRTRVTLSPSALERRQVRRDVKQLQQRINEVITLQSAQADLDFSDQTGATPRAALERGIRAEQQGLLSVLVDRRLKSPALARLLGRLQGKPGLSRTMRAAVRSWSEAIEDTRLIPSKMVREAAILNSKSAQAYADAKERSDYAAYEPFLAQQVERAQKTATLTRGNYARRLGREPTSYEVMLTSMMGAPHSEAELDQVFGELRPRLVSLVKRIEESKHAEPRAFAFLERKIDPQEMESFTTMVLKQMGFDFKRGTLAKSVHPFTTGIFAPYDVRITVDRPSAKRISIREAMGIFFSGVHEAGHALYDQGGRSQLGRLGMTGGPMELHESQSRLWENNVARGRAFWSHYFPLLKQRFPRQLKGVSLDDFYRAINQVEPSPIRVEADEVTYNLHVLLRYGVEKKLFSASPAERKALLPALPKLWNQMMQEYIGYTPKNDREGVLQDVHWSDGSFGYFPAYTLGNLAAAQIYERAKQEMPDLEAEIARGNLRPLRSWLRKNIHSVGQTETPDQVLRRVTGEPLSARHFVSYLERKYAEIYGLPSTDTTPGR